MCRVKAWASKIYTDLFLCDSSFKPVTYPPSAEVNLRAMITIFISFLKTSMSDIIQSEDKWKVNLAD